VVTVETILLTQISRRYYLLNAASRISKGKSTGKSKDLEAIVNEIRVAFADHENKEHKLPGS
jgi:hypothetical protein